MTTPTNVGRGPSVSDLLHRASARVDANFDAAMGDSKLTSRQFVVLRCVADNDNINQIRIATLTGIDRSTVTDLVSRMVSRNLLERERSQADQRAYEVRLTAHGREQLAQALPAAAELDQKILARLSPELRAEFVTVLEKISQCAA